MRTDIMISAESLIYELRVCRSLLRENNERLYASQETLAAQNLIHNMIEVIEDATKLLQAPTGSSPSEAGVGAQDGLGDGRR